MPIKLQAYKGRGEAILNDLYKILKKLKAIQQFQCAYNYKRQQSKALTMCGYFSGSVTLISVSLIFKYWSTECRVPHILKSFFSSTTTSLPTNDLKKE